MKYHLPALALLTLLAGPTSVFAAEPLRPAPAPVGRAPAMEDNPTIKAVNFRGVRLSEAVTFLKDSCPRFKAVVVADPQCPDPDPVLPDIELKNIELEQFLQLLEKTLPQLAYERIDGPQGAVCLIKLAAPAGAQPPRLQVYRLSPLIPAGAADRKASLNDILSLVQAALEAQGSASNVLMKVHEGTGTLIFRGNAAQTEVVERALKALEPTTAESERVKVQEQMQAERDRSQGRLAQLEERLEEAKMESIDARKRVSQQMTEIEALKARLAAQGDKKP